MSHALLLDRRGIPEEGRLLIPEFARHVIPRDSLTLRELAVFYPMAGGAGQNTFPLEGLDNTLNRVTAVTWYMRLFTSQTATTVPSDDSTLTGAAGAPYTTGTSPPVEVLAAGGYAAVTMANTVWGANTTIAAKGRRSTTTGSQNFPQSTGSWGTINGYFLATTAASTGQNTGVALMYANFSDGLGVAINGAGYTLQVTPYLELDSSQ